MTDTILKAINWGPPASKSNNFAVVAFFNGDLFVPFIDLVPNPDLARIQRCLLSTLESCTEISPVSEAITLT